MALAIAATGCALMPDPYAPDTGRLDPKGEVVPDVTIGPGDELDITFIYTPNLNTVQAVKRDGTISLDLIGEVKAEGKTAAELSQLLTERYEDDLKDPEVRVLVRSSWARRIYVLGQVHREGAMALPKRMDVVEALAEAGGYDPDSAEMSSVLVIRREGEKIRIGKLNLDPAFGIAPPEPGEVIEPFYLKPGDIVYVPETKIVQLDRWIDQHIHQVIRGTEILTRTGTSEFRYDLGNN